MTRTHSHLAKLALVTLAVAGLAACGTDDNGSAAPASTSPAVPTAPVTTPAPAPKPTLAPAPAPTTTKPPHHTTVPPAPPTTANSGGGGMQAGAPTFQSFNVSSSAECQNGNATAQMSFSTLNVVDIEIKIGDGNFAETAGYGPNESSVVASIPCNGPGSSSIQLRGCTENHTCVDSAQQAVQITA